MAGKNYCELSTPAENYLFVKSQKLERFDNSSRPGAFQTSNNDLINSECSLQRILSGRSSREGTQ